MIIVFVLEILFIAIICGVGLISTTISFASFGYLWFGRGGGTLTIHDKYGSGSSSLELVDSTQSAMILLGIRIVYFTIMWIKHQARRRERYTTRQKRLWIVIFLGSLMTGGLLYRWWW